MLNKAERVENVKSVMMINYVSTNLFGNSVVNPPS